jgi:hypothetical protein
MNKLLNKTLYITFGIISTAGLIAYALSYIIKMPAVSSSGFVPETLTSYSGGVSFGIILSAFILLYAFPFIPVNVLFTIENYKINPHGMILAGCLTCLSLILEIINNLPLLAAGIFTGKFSEIPPGVLLYLRQTETIRYLSFDVAGFSLLYIAVFIYAAIYFKINKLFSYTIFTSITLFILNVPFLWISSKAAIILMSTSVFALAVVPVFQAMYIVEKK